MHEALAVVIAYEAHERVLRQTQERVSEVYYLNRFLLRGKLTRHIVSTVTVNSSAIFIVLRSFVGLEVL
jgi:hypothetical protein